MDDAEVDDSNVPKGVLRGRSRIRVRIQLSADGSIQNKKHETICLLMADGVSEQLAWKLTSPRAAKGLTIDYRRRIVGDPVFRKRLEMLMAEKVLLEQDTLWGKAAWQIEQYHRHAVNTNDMKAMGEAMKLSLQLATSRANFALKTQTPVIPVETGDNEPETAPNSGKVGKPMAEHPQTKRSPSQIQSKLLAIDDKKTLQ